MFQFARSKWILLGAVAVGAVTLSTVGICWAIFNSAQPEVTQTPQGSEPRGPIAQVKPALEGPAHTAPGEMLERALKRMHDEAVHRFLARPENGMRRMINLPVKEKSEWKDSLWSPGELSLETKLEHRADLARIHHESLRDFASPTQKDEPMVKFRARPLDDGDLLQDEMKKLMKEKDWDIKTLDLMGVVKHEHPVIYVSDKLPKMKELDKVPTRHLDFFEQAGLEELKKDDDQFIRSRDGTIRMLGAIRAKSECLSCHQGAEGTLLGAFSYTLRTARYGSPNRLDGILQDQQDPPRGSVPKQ